MKRIFILTLIFSSLGIFAQNEASFSAKVNKDEVLMDNYIRIEFTLNNVNGKFEAPSFKDFNIVSGPNTNSSMYVVNGKTSSKLTYTYYLKPKKEGELFIENAYVSDEQNPDLNFESSPIKIIVKPNPEGIIEEEDSEIQSESLFFSFPDHSDFFSQKMPISPQKKKEEISKEKPKRKIKRI